MKSSSPDEGSTLFSTGIGLCGIAWSNDEILATQLPERTPAATARRLHRLSGSDPAVRIEVPAVAREAIDRIRAVIAGRRDDLRTIPISSEAVDPFAVQVRELTRNIPVGQVSTYGDLARRAGRPHGARAVGAVMGSNTLPLIVPCHRVVAASGRVGGFSAAAGPELKLRLLHTERLAADPATSTFDTAVAERGLREADPELAAVIDAVGRADLRPRTATTVFGDLVEAVVHEQVSPEVGATLHARLCATMPDPLEGPTPPGVLQRSDGQLAELGLSGPNVTALRSLTEAAYNGRLPGDAAIGGLGDDEAVSVLMGISGISRPTAQRLLICRLHRPDVLCEGDRTLRAVMHRTHRSSLAEPGVTIRTIAERWRPHRSLACWYLWSYAAALSWS